MPTVRLATFNVENLFARWRFRDDLDPAEANKSGWTVDRTLFVELGVDAKAITGAAVRELRADVIGFQEVENVDTLKHFRARSLGGRAAFPFVGGVDGNDPRLIDVALMSKLPITRIRSYQHVPDPVMQPSPLFSRDCLEVDVEVSAQTTLTVYVNHFKSMIGGRAATRPRRERQGEAVKRLIIDRFGSTAGDRPFVILGDFNDYLETDSEGPPGITALTDWDQVENVVERLPTSERWTHYWARGNEYRQLDYLLLSSMLADSSPGSPEIMRKGLPLRADRYQGERFLGVGRDRPQASDHCPVLFALNTP
jgi:endonuclease/exonuclease/phosphatase family metal-dependent hydrolase